MKKYYLTDGVAKLGPFDLEELKSKNITAETPVWYEGISDFTNAGSIPEINAMLITDQPSLVNVSPAETISSSPEIIPVADKVASPEKPASARSSVIPDLNTSSVPAGRKPVKAITWVLSLLVLAAAGFFIFMDLEKNRGYDGGPILTADYDTLLKENKTSTSNADLEKSNTSTDTTSITPIPDTTVANTTEPVTTVVPVANNTDPKNVNVNTTASNDAKKLAAKKIEEEKKKQLAIKKAAEEKRKMELAILARELDMRNNWSRYITTGRLSLDTKGDGIKAFSIPVYNGTDAMIDKMTIRLDYTKKNDKKVVKTETVTVYNIPAKSNAVGNGPESKKGDNVNVTITSVVSRKLHLCYPNSGGNASDPYYCN